MSYKYTDVLLKSTLFKDIHNDELQSMMNCLQPRILYYNRGDIIAMADSPFENVGILLEGEASVIKETSSGNRVIMRLLKPGDMFGEMVVFSNQCYWPATVIAQHPSKVFFLTRQRIIGQCEKACQWHRTIIENMLRIVSERALNLNRKVEYLSIKSMRGKISTYLLEQYKKMGNTTFMLPLNRNELADYLNVSRPSMSRELCRMRDEGVIDFHMSTIKIRNIESLKNMAE